MHIIFVGESGVLAQKVENGQIGTKGIHEGLLARAVQHLTLCVWAIKALVVAAGSYRRRPKVCDVRALPERPVACGAGEIGLVSHQNAARAA